MRALIVEDSPTLCSIYEAYLAGLGLSISVAETFAGAESLIESNKPDLILLDIELPDGNGLDLLPKIRALKPAPVSIVMTGHGTEFAEKALDAGAADFLAKPFDAVRLRVTVENAMQRKELSTRIDQLSAKRDQLGALQGSSAVMRAVYDVVERLAVSSETVLITGESGTGKELTARAIHDWSARAPEPFAVVDCARLPTEMGERELFGVNESSDSGWIRRGLVPRAEGGTLFLDEVSELSYELQSILLRFLETGIYMPVGAQRESEANVRIIASTNRDPLEEVRAGRLREDLFYRLHVLPVRMPPLRERLEDVPALAEDMLFRLARQAGRQFEPLSQEARVRLQQYAWPGNVRQLENMMRWLATMLVGRQVSVDAIDDAIKQFDQDQVVSEPASPVEVEMSPPGEGKVEPLWITEKHAIERAIKQCDGNIHKAAALLEVAPSTIYRKMQGWKSANSRR